MYELIYQEDVWIKQSRGARWELKLEGIDRYNINGASTSWGIWKICNARKRHAIHADYLGNKVTTTVADEIMPEMFKISEGIPKEVQKVFK